MRRGEMNVFGAILIQLLMAAVIVGVVWVPFGNRAVNGDLYKELYYAEDNALIANTLLGVQRGTMIVHYPLADKDYTLTLQPGMVGFTNARRRGGVAINIRYAEDERAQTDTVADHPRMYEWKKTLNVLTIELISASSNCRDISEAPDWRDVPVGYGGDYASMAGLILVEGLSTDANKVTRGTGITNLIINKADQEMITIEYPSSVLYEKLYCNLAEELLLAGEEQISRIENIHTRNTVTITIPKDRSDYQLLRAPLINGYKRLME